MARLPRLCIANQLHLLAQKSEGESEIFADAVDCEAYLACVRESSAALKIALHAFALTHSRAYLLATPPSESALSALLQSVGRRFVRAYNRRHGRRGRLWDGRYRATVVEPEAYFVDCLRFVETAPVRERLVERADEWAWSSAAHHAGRRSIVGLTEHPQFWSIGNTPFEREAHYRQLLDLPLDGKHAEVIEGCVLHGWALGTRKFLESMGKLGSRRLAPLPRGRRG
jgi:putative transposase